MIDCIIALVAVRGDYLPNSRCIIPQHQPVVPVNQGPTNSYNDGHLHSQSRYTNSSSEAMTMAVHAYVRPYHDEERESIIRQHDIIVRYCRSHGLGRPSTWYGDTYDSGQRFFGDREAGAALCRALCRGDVVVLADL